MGLGGVIGEAKQNSGLEARIRTHRRQHETSERYNINVSRSITEMKRTIIEARSDNENGDDTTGG